MKTIIHFVKTESGVIIAIAEDEDVNVKAMFPNSRKSNEAAYIKDGRHLIDLALISTRELEPLVKYGSADLVKAAKKAAKGREAEIKKRMEASDE